MHKSSIALLLSLVATAALAKDRLYESLLVIQEDISITNVEALILPGKSDNRPAVELRVRGMSACGDEILATQFENVLRFYQVGSPAPHGQPGCYENIQYFWTPGDLDMPEGQQAIVKLSIPAATPGGKKGGYEVSVLVVKKFGELPRGNGVGHYLEYSQLKITKV
jgi:hypothetical protein